MLLDASTAPREHASNRRGYCFFGVLFLWQREGSSMETQSSNPDEAVIGDGLYLGLSCIAF
jgi:hypothetical protein